MSTNDLDKDGKGVVAPPALSRASMSQLMMQRSCSLGQDSGRYAERRNSELPMQSKGRFVRGTTLVKPPNHEEPGVIAILLHPMNVLLVFLPLGTAAYFLNWGSSYTFWFNFLTLVPLAKILGDATEELAASLKNDMVAGILNATFGNAVEMVLTVQTLRAGLFDVVKATLLGSVLSNTLLVLGMSFFSGGLFTFIKKKKSKSREAEKQPHYMAMPLPENATVHGDTVGGLEETIVNAQSVVFENEKVQTFSVLGALVNTSMLFISCTSFSLITVYRTVLDTNDHHDAEEMKALLLEVSRLAAIFIMAAYVAYIVFQLITHKIALANEEEEEDDGDADEHMSIMKAMGLLFATTLVVAYCSELLVASIEGVTEHTSLSKHFIGIILLPIVGNACEHASAIRFAVQDKMGLSVGIAVGSSTQIALFVVPFSVLIGWAQGQNMDLNFGVFNTVVMTLSIIVVLSMVVDGHSNWLQGYLLMTVYTILAVMYYYLPSDMEPFSSN